MGLTPNPVLPDSKRRRDKREGSGEGSGPPGVDWRSVLALISALVAVVVVGGSLWLVRLVDERSAALEGRLAAVRAHVEAARASAREANELVLLAERQAEIAAGRAESARGAAGTAARKAQTAARVSQQLRSQAQEAGLKAADVEYRLEESIARASRIEESLRRTREEVARLALRLQTAEQQTARAREEERKTRGQLASAQAREDGMQRREQRLSKEFIAALGEARGVVRQAIRGQTAASRSQERAEAALQHIFREAGLSGDRNSPLPSAVPNLHDYNNLAQRARAARAEARRALEKARVELDSLALVHR